MKFMSLTIRARHSLTLIAIALAVPCATARAQASPSVPADSSPRAGTPSLDTVRVKANAPTSRTAYEKSLIVGNRLLARELARYDKRILELEKKLDSLRFEAAHRWKDAREMESAALAAREQRIAMERRLAQFESDTARARRGRTPAGPN